MDYTEYLLRTEEDIKNFQRQMGKQLPVFMDSIKKWLHTLPNGIWIEYLKGVPQKNIKVIIGCICLYMQEYDFVKEVIDFNSNATMIRYSRYEWHKPGEYYIYEKFRKKIQNNSSSE